MKEDYCLSFLISLEKPCITFWETKYILLLKSDLIKQLCNFHYTLSFCTSKSSSKQTQHINYILYALHFSVKMKLCKTSKYKLYTSSPRYTVCYMYIRQVSANNSEDLLTLLAIWRCGVHATRRSRLDSTCIRARVKCHIVFSIYLFHIYLQYERARCQYDFSVIK